MLIIALTRIVMFKVFVSHSSDDKALVDALRELITAAFSDEVEIKYSTAS